MTVYAYLRVSTKDQTTDNQKIKIGATFQVDEWLVEAAGVSGSVRALSRPVFSDLAKVVKSGDTVITVSLDRLGRDTEDVLHTIRNFREAGVKVRIMELDGVDLTSQTGKILVTLLSMVAELERDKCIERTAAGVVRAKSEGKVFGRYLTIPPDVLNLMIKEHIGGTTYRGLSEMFKINKDTICQTLNKWEGNFSEYTLIWEKQQQQKLDKQNKESGAK